MWQHSWCDMSKVRPEYIIRIKIRAKSVLTKFGFWAHNFLLNCPPAYPVQVQFDSHISETFCRSKYSFSQFWTVFPSFGWEKLAKTGLSQFIPLNGKNRFWTGKNQPWVPKFDQNLQCYSLKCTLLITTKFCTCHNCVTVVTCAKCCCDGSSIFWSN